MWRSGFYILFLRFRFKYLIHELIKNNKQTLQNRYKKKSCLAAFLCWSFIVF